MPVYDFSSGFNSINQSLDGLGKMIQERRAGELIANALNLDTSMSTPSLAGLSPSPAPATPSYNVNGNTPSFVAAQGGKPSAELAGLFDATEQKYQLPQGFLSRTAYIESKFNPAAKNPNSSAGGLFQQIDSNWKTYGQGDRFDPVASTEAAARFASENKTLLSRALGREPTAGELYLAHQQGPGGALKLLSNPDARAADVVGAQAVRLNGGDPNMSAGAFATLWTRKVDGQGNPVPSTETAAVPARSNGRVQVASNDPSFVPSAIPFVGGGESVPGAKVMPTEVASAAPATARQAAPAPAQAPAHQQVAQTSVQAPAPYRPNLTPPQVAQQGMTDQQKATIQALVRNPSTRQAGLALWGQLREGSQEAAKRVWEVQKIIEQRNFDLYKLGVDQQNKDRDFGVTQGNLDVSRGNLDVSRQRLDYDKTKPIQVGDTLVDPVTRQPIYTAPQRRQVDVVNGRVLVTDPNDQYSIDTTPGGMPTGYRPLTTEEKAAYGIPENTGAVMGPDGKPSTLPGTANTTVKLPAQDTAFEKTSGEAIGKRFDAIILEGDSARTDLALVDQLRSLGGAINFKTMPALRGQLAEYGVRIGNDVGEIQAYNSIIDKLTPQQRVPGSGASSDLDVKMFKSALPRLINSQEGIALITDTMQALGEDKIARAVIAERAQTKEIPPDEAIRQLRALPSPMATFRERVKAIPQGRKSDAGDGALPAGMPAPRQQQQQAAPPVQGARQAPDGNWYVSDPNRPGKYLQVQ